MIGGGDGLHAGKLTKIGHELVEEEVGARGIIARRDAGAVDIDAGHEEVIGLKAQRLMEQGVNAGDGPAGAGDEHEGEGDLRGDEDAAGAAKAAAARGSAGTGEVAQQVWLQSTPSGEQGKQ